MTAVILLHLSKSVAAKYLEIAGTTLFDSSLFYFDYLPI